MYLQKINRIIHAKKGLGFQTWKTIDKNDNISTRIIHKKLQVFKDWESKPICIRPETAIAEIAE